MSKPLLHNYDLDDQCYRLRLTASVCDVALEILNLDVFPGDDHLKPDYLVKNPLGRVPLLEHDGLLLRETGAIQVYLTRLSGAKTLMPTDAADHAAMLDWLFFADRDAAVVSAARATALLDAPGDGPALITAAKAMLRIMDDHMTRQGVLDRAFFAGADLSLADLALFPAFALSRDFGVDHDEYPALRTWARRVRRTEGFITMPGIPDYH